MTSFFQQDWIIFYHQMDCILKQDNAIFLQSVIINKTTWFSRLWLYFDLYASIIFSVLWGIYKTLKAIDLLFDSNFLQSSTGFAGNSIPFHSYWSIKGLIFYILCGYFLMFWWFNATVIAYWKQLLPLFCGFIVAFFIF